MVNKKVLLIVGGIVLVDYLLAKVNKPKLYVVDDRKNYNAKVVPPFGIYINKSQSDNSLLIQHEMVHWKQYQRIGAILFYLRYFTEYAIYGYDNMPMEIEARKEVGESEYCIKNYTECVRNAEAKTVSNPEFRKIGSTEIGKNKIWYISDSSIHGKGVFSNIELPTGTVIDIAAVEIKIPNTESVFRITDFGSKINHSWHPNAEIALKNDKYIVVTRNKVFPKEEITLNYDKNPIHFLGAKSSYK